MNIKKILINAFLLLVIAALLMLCVVSHAFDNWLNLIGVGVFGDWRQILHFVQDDIFSSVILRRSRRIFFRLLFGDLSFIPIQDRGIADRQGRSERRQYIVLLQGHVSP